MAGALRARPRSGAQEPGDGASGLLSQPRGWGWGHRGGMLGGREGGGQGDFHGSNARLGP